MKILYIELCTVVLHSARRISSPR